MGRSPMVNVWRDTRQTKPRGPTPRALGVRPGGARSRVFLRGTGLSVPKMPPRALKNRLFKPLRAPFFYPERKNLQLKQRLREIYIV